MKNRCNWRAGLPLLLAAITSGCLGANPLPASEDKAEQPADLDQHRIYPAFYTDPPNCVIVLPGNGASNVTRLDLIEGALSRQLSGRIERVIHPRERRRLVRAMAFNLHDKLDAQQFATKANCPALLRWSVRKMGNNYTPIWSEKYMTIQIELTRAHDGATLWQATATAARSSGDPPLSLLSLPFAAYKTARFQADQDAVASMIDDLARRLLANLPDVRE